MSQIPCQSPWLSTKIVSNRHGSWILHQTRSFKRYFKKVKCPLWKSERATDTSVSLSPRFESPHEHLQAEKLCCRQFRQRSMKQGTKEKENYDFRSKKRVNCARQSSKRSNECCGSRSWMSLQSVVLSVGTWRTSRLRAPLVYDIKIRFRITSSAFQVSDWHTYVDFCLNRSLCRM